MVMVLIALSVRTLEAQHLLTVVLVADPALIGPDFLPVGSVVVAELMVIPVGVAVAAAILAAAVVVKIQVLILVVAAGLIIQALIKRIQPV
jgi:hypothetical protein